LEQKFFFLFFLNSCEYHGVLCDLENSATSIHVDTTTRIRSIESKI
jgi:hypothetical protein